MDNVAAPRDPDYLTGAGDSGRGASPSDAIGDVDLRLVEGMTGAEIADRTVL